MKKLLIVLLLLIPVLSFAQNPDGNRISLMFEYSPFSHLNFGSGLYYNKGFASSLSIGAPLLENMTFIVKVTNTNQLMLQTNPSFLSYSQSNNFDYSFAIKYYLP